MLKIDLSDEENNRTDFVCFDERWQRMLQQIKYCKNKNRLSCFSCLIQIIKHTGKYIETFSNEIKVYISPLKEIKRQEKMINSS